MGGALTFAGLVVFTLHSHGVASFDPWTALVVFAPLALLGLLRLIVRGIEGARTWGTIALLLGLLGIGLLFYLEYSGALVHVMTRPDRPDVAEAYRV